MGFNKRGATFIELLLVITILATLTLVAVSSMNLSDRLGKSEQVKSHYAAASILNALNQYTIENNGQVPSVIDDNEKKVANGLDAADICNFIVPKYIASLPIDDRNNEAFFENCENYNTGFQISKSANRLKIKVENNSGDDIMIIQ